YVCWLSAGPAGRRQLECLPVQASEPVREVPLKTCSTLNRQAKHRSNPGRALLRLLQTCAQHIHMTHLAATACLCLAIKVELCTGYRQHGRPIRFPHGTRGWIEPDVAQQIQHDDRTEA